MADPTRHEPQNIYPTRPRWKFLTQTHHYTSGARDLKIGMHIPHMDGSKVTNQIFDILPKSQLIYIFTSLIAPIILKLKKSL